MTTSITLPEQLAQRLQQRAKAERLSAEALAAAYIEAGLTENERPIVEQPVSTPEEDPELLGLVARIKAMPRNPASIIPAKGNLAEVLAAMVNGEPDREVLDALDAAEMELRALDRAKAIAEGRG